MKIKTILILGSFTFGLPLGAQTQSSRKPTITKEQAATSKLNPYLAKARGFFVANDMEKSSEAIYKAADVIHLRMITDETLPTNSVYQAANALERLAERVEEGSIKDPKTLDKVFARANVNMAKYYSRLAKVAAAQEKPRVTKSALSRTADYIEGAAQWSGKKLSDTSKSTVAKMREGSEAVIKTPGKLVKGGLGILDRLSKGKSKGNDAASEKKPT